MLNQATLEKMQEMKMHAMAEAFDQQLGSSQYAELSFEERTGWLSDTEWTCRQQRSLTRRLKRTRKPERRPENWKNRRSSQP